MKKVFLGIIIIIILAVIILGGLFAYQYFTNKSQQNSEFFASRQKTNQTQTVSTAGWKIYKNDIYGFEVQYPFDGLLTHYSLAVDYYVVKIIIPSSQSFMIDVSPQKNCLNFNANVANIYVDDVPAIKSVKIFSGGQEYRNAALKILAEGEEYRNVTFVKGKNCYSINLLGADFEDAEKMLTTFKFTK